MPIVQHLLLITRPLAARVRSVRRPFRPSAAPAPYRLPHDVRDRLTTSLAPFRNRDAAFALAAFLARYHSNPARVLGAFAIDRRVLAGHDGLELTEARVRGAIRTLEAVGFLERAIAPSGSRYKATVDGLHRKPIQYVFGSEYGPLFIAANKQASAARGGVSGARHPPVPAPPPRPAVGILKARCTSSPKYDSTSKTVNLGEIRNGLPAEPSAPTALELALQRLSQGVFGKPRVGSDGGKRDPDVRR